MHPKTKSSVPIIILRIVFGLQFAATGLFSAFNWDSTVNFNAIMTGSSAAPIFSGVGIVLVIIGGMSIVFNYKIRLGALCIILFLLPATTRHLIVVRQADTLISRVESNHKQIAFQLHALAQLKALNNPVAAN